MNMKKTTGTIACFACLEKVAVIAKVNDRGDIRYQLPEGWWIHFLDVETTMIYCQNCGEKE